MLTRLPPSHLNLAELGQDTPQPLLTGPVISHRQHARSTPLQPERSLEIETCQIPNTDPAPQGYTFVNIQTSTGRRDRAAESQIRSHAMKRIQQQRRRFKQSLQIAPGSSSSATKLSCPCWRQDPSTQNCPCMGPLSTESRGRFEARARLNVAQARNAPSLVPSSAHLSESDYCHCGRVKFKPHVESYSVSIPVSLFSSLSLLSFLSFLNKKDRALGPRMESLLSYRK